MVEKEAGTHNVENEIKNIADALNEERLKQEPKHFVVINVVTQLW